jgi:predicted NBD/HSP70 family sugar kinase
LHGKNNLAGEIGGWLCPTAPIEPRPGAEGHAWSSGELRPLEEVASVPALLKAVRAAADKTRTSSLHGKKDGLSLDDVALAAEQGDEAVVAVLGDIAQTLGWTLCQMNALFNPEKIILAGSLVALGEHLLTPLRKAACRYCTIPQEQAPAIVNSELGSFNGALGAAALALHEWTPKE